nr:PREDICTED: matrix metalloproteinase-14 isoform X2 [Bemisia tabaci]
MALASQKSRSTRSSGTMYLSQFGYLSPSVRNPNSGHLMTADTMSRAISEFQSFAGLNITGHLDGDTLEMMSLPRCGVRDRVGFATSSRSKRYALQGSRWRVKDLTYKISKYPRNLGKSETDEEVRKAFSVWSDVTPLSFTQKKVGQVHIEIRFERGEHGDGDPFDGPGGTLAHAFFPVYGGDAHFDDSEKWTVNSYRGTNLFQVAAHEFGHSLGLSHSDVRSALMAPFYRGYEPAFNLDSDDVEAIQALYGSRDDSEAHGSEDDNTSAGSGKKPSTEVPPTDDGEDAELCTDARIDTIFNSAEGVTYAFKGQHYWKLTEESIAPGYPKLISKSWIGLPGNIDAAFTYKNGKTYFFKGSQYWRYTGKTMDGDYPKYISEGFTGIPDNLDAAIVWSGNGKIYFFKGSKFWRFDPTMKPPVKSTYPKPLSNWEGIPDNLDAALHYTNGYTYFFKNGMYWRFNDRTFAVDSADPPFPRSAGYWWFGCRSATKAGSTPSHSSAATDTDGQGSELEPSWVIGQEGKHKNQNTDVDDLILDAGNPWAWRFRGWFSQQKASPEAVSSNGTSSSKDVAEAISPETILPQNTSTVEHTSSSSLRSPSIALILIVFGIILTSF